MKKKSRRRQDDLRPEYDFWGLPGGVKGKHAAQYRQGTNLVLLDRDVAKVFRDDADVNEALRTVMKAAARLPRKTA
ncbi:MAG: hypothetical protein ACREQ7_19230 [Candidatus Binatia bacterium]